MVTALVFGMLVGGQVLAGREASGFKAELPNGLRAEIVAMTIDRFKSYGPTGELLRELIDPVTDRSIMISLGFPPPRRKVILKVWSPSNDIEPPVVVLNDMDQGVQFSSQGNQKGPGRWWDVALDATEDSSTHVALGFGDRWKTIANWSAFAEKIAGGFQPSIHDDFFWLKQDKDAKAFQEEQPPAESAVVTIPDELLKFRARQLRLLVRDASGGPLDCSVYPIYTRKLYGTVFKVSANPSRIRSIALQESRLHFVDFVGLKFPPDIGD